MWKTINKFLSLIVLIWHPRTPKDYKYYIRDTYRYQLSQLGYIFRDYFAKRPYKTISFSGEFAPELQFVLPFIYWHHKNGTLKSIVSSKDTNCFYFFTDKHTESFSARTPEGNYNYEIPRILYSHNYNIKKWLPVPLKKHYQNDIYTYNKPILIIANRYNMEWDGPPISYFSLEVLDELFVRLKNDFQIIYNRPGINRIVEDNSAIYDLGDYEWLTNHHPDVIQLEHLYQENKIKARSFNEFQLYIYANSSHFISVHGGTATLASYFGGTNIILSKKGPEHYFNCFTKLYPKLSGAQVFHAKSDDELLALVNQKICRHDT